MTGLNAARAGGQIDATTLGAGTVQGASLLTSGNSSTVTLRRESCQPLAIGHNKPIIKKPKDPGFITKLNTAVLAQTANNDEITQNFNFITGTYNSQFTLFGFNNAVLTTPNGSFAGYDSNLSYPYTNTATMAPTTSPINLEVFGDPATGVIDVVYAFQNYNVTFNSPTNAIINSGQLIMGHWEVTRNGSVTYNQYTSDSVAPTRLQGIYNFANPAGLGLSQWNTSPSGSAQAYITTRRTTLVMYGLAPALGIKLDGKKGIMVNKNQIPTSYIMTPVSNRIRAHMNRSKDNIIRGTLPISLDDPAIVYSNYRVICSSSQGREL